MANVYGDALSSSTSALVTGYRASAGISHGRVRKTRSELSTTAATTDVIRAFTMKSGDRLDALTLATDGGATAGAVNIGIYLKGSTSHDGAVVDADLFSAALAVTTAGTNDAYADSGTVVEVDRGKTLWELAAIGAASYTEDPQVEFDICIVPSTTINAATVLVLTAEYTAGD